MRIFVVGASGAIGSRLVPQLIQAGHEVVGTHHTSGAARVRALGARPVELDVLDAHAVRKAVLEAEPEAVIHQATALAGARLHRSLDRTFEPTNRVRTEGTDALLAAAREAAVPRIIAQSFANYRYARHGGPVKTEDDPLDRDPAPTTRQTNAAMTHLDEAVTAAGGIVLRYGGFYGASDQLIEAMRKRRMPLVGSGSGVTSWIHLEDAAAATVLALDATGPAIYNIVDDEPAPGREWMPVLAGALGAKPPRRIPFWLARTMLGRSAVTMDQARGASNAKAKRELSWTPRYPSWRVGFAAAYAARETPPRPARSAAR
jgi:nucleoside-diphosphate-sugar epimerase